MTLNELLEHAVLDAYGLLDEEQRLAFERGFRAAPRSVQMQIRREQERVAGFESSLSTEQPSPELKERVVAAVRAEIEAERANSELSALALRGGDLSGQVEAMGRRYVSGWWQTAAIALLAVSVVLSTIVGSGLTQRENATVEPLISALGTKRNAKVGDLATEFLTGSKFDRIVLSPIGDAPVKFRGLSACAWVPSTGVGYIGLSADKAPESKFRIRVKNSAGVVLTSTDFTMSTQLEVCELELLEWSGSTVEIALVDLQGNETLVFSRKV